MGLFDWMKGSRETQSVRDLDEHGSGPPFSTREGNPINLILHSEWESDGMGVCQLRSHIGESCEGYHAGMQVSHKGGSAWTWSLDPYPSVTAAKKATDAMVLHWHIRMSPYADYIDALQWAHARRAERSERSESRQSHGEPSAGREQPDDDERDR